MSTACASSPWRLGDTPDKPCVRRVETACIGLDPMLQGLSSDGEWSYGPGLRVPPLASSSVTNRYLFLLASVTLTAYRRVNIVGVRQCVRIGFDANSGVVPAYPVSTIVRDPEWRFVDGNVSFHLRWIRNRPALVNRQSVRNTDSFARGWSDAPALLFDGTPGFPAKNLNVNGTPDFYTALTSYTAPYGGHVPGTPIGKLGTWYDLRFPIDAPAGQLIDPICCEGPGTIALFASVLQPSATHSGSIVIPAAVPLPVKLDEEALIAAGSPWNGAQYWSVEGSLAYEEVV